MHLMGPLMRFTTFARTGLTVWRICLVTGIFGKQADEQESFRIFDTAADAGVNFIDMADIYPGGAELTVRRTDDEVPGV
jgi:1-deoxyxylulose-5-phosphate synthase